VKRRTRAKPPYKYTPGPTVDFFLLVSFFFHRPHSSSIFAFSWSRCPLAHACGRRYFSRRLTLILNDAVQRSDASHLNGFASGSKCSRESFCLTPVVLFSSSLTAPMSDDGQLLFAIADNLLCPIRRGSSAAVEKPRVHPYAYHCSKMSVAGHLLLPSPGTCKN